MGQFTAGQILTAAEINNLLPLNEVNGTAQPTATNYASKCGHVSAASYTTGGLVVTYGAQFPTATDNVLVTLITPGGFPQVIGGGVSATQIQVKLYTTAGAEVAAATSVSFYWFAVGH